MAENAEEKTVFTIGHSNHALGKFLDLLKKHEIEVLVDVRSQPYSRYNPQFNRENIKGEVEDIGIVYKYLGDCLGGRPKEREFYDSEGRVVYSKIAASPSFVEGISRLQREMERYTTAIMCAEENPLSCHRTHLVAGELCRRGVTVRHIRADGRVQAQGEIFGNKADEKRGGEQLKLF